jgi:amidohydrolase
MTAKDRIQRLAHEKLPKWREVRRHLHQNPELSFKEYKTQEFIIHKLKEIGIQDIETCTETGVVALIKGNNPQRKTVALRGDIDALPILEENSAEYSSKNSGVMHACGHDVHTTCVLAAAEILNELKTDFSGTVKLIFQPGEERLPGGASLMIKDGVLENPPVDVAYGQHVMPLIDAGKVGFRKGLYMASADEIYITIKGKGGHGAHPHMNIDPIAISAQVITSLQTIVSRRSKPATPSVLSIGKIVGNGATNIIPDQVYMEGTFRTFDEKWRAEAHQLIQQQVEQMAAAMGASAEVDIRKGYPFLKNDENTTEQAQRWAEEYLGKENVEQLDIWPAGEDFAFFSQEVPSCFYRLGTRNESKGINSMLHTPTFDVDESAIEVGGGLMAWIAFCKLNDTSS